MNDIYFQDTVYWQRFLVSAGYGPLEIDGDFGPASKAAALKFEADSLKVKQDEGEVDSRSEGNLITLLPEVQKFARQFLHKTNNIFGATIKIISGTRTYKEQNQIYKQGRSLPGPIVTHAAAGQSNHNFGLAFDVGCFVNGEYLDDSPIYTQCGKVWQALDSSDTWGGVWHGSSEDDPHMEYHPTWAKGLSEEELVIELNKRFLNGKTII